MQTNVRILIVLVFISLVAAAGFSMQISGKQLSDLSKASSADASGIKVVTGNPFSGNSFNAKIVAPPGQSISTYLKIMNANLINGN